MPASPVSPYRAETDFGQWKFRSNPTRRAAFVRGVSGVPVSGCRFSHSRANASGSTGPPNPNPTAAVPPQTPPAAMPSA